MIGRDTLGATRPIRRETPTLSVASLILCSNLPVKKAHSLPVGHSLGGAYVRMFAAQQHKSVVGLVLVDATNPSAMGDVGLPPIRKGGVASFIASNKILFQIADHIGLIRVT